VTTRDSKSRLHRGLGAKLGRLALAIVAALVASVAFVGLLRVAVATGLVPPPAPPPPHFTKLRDRDGRVLLDAKGRELFAIDPAVASYVGDAAKPPGRDRLWTPKAKDPGVFRILSIGESTTRGVGYDSTASYSRFLELRLNRLLAPARTVEVVNCGKSGYDSHDWLTLVDELADFAPDLLVVYVGHNELKKPNLVGVLEPSKARLRRSPLLRLLFGEPADDVGVPPKVQVGAFVTPKQREFAMEWFEQGLRALLDFARERRVPVVLCVPASNVLDHGPRLSVVRAGASAEENLARVAEVERTGASFEFGALPVLYDGIPADEAHARELESANRAVNGALADVDRLLTVQPDAALLHFRRARLLLARTRDEHAFDPSPVRSAFARSLELDNLPERASPDLVARTRDVAKEYGASTTRRPSGAAAPVLVADVEARFEREAANVVPGFDLFFDYCHPNLRGHWLIADEIVQALAASDVFGASKVDLTREPGRDAANPAIPANPASPPAERTLFHNYCEQLGLSEAASARFNVEKAKLVIVALGTQPGARPEEWRNAQELLDAAARQDEALEKSDAEWNVLAGLCRAGQGDRDGARRRLLDAEKSDAAAVRALAAKAVVLTGIVRTLAAVGVTLDARGFHWDGHE
jgi:lysophospholipase L1-like esterase